MATAAGSITMGVTDNLVWATCVGAFSDEDFERYIARLTEVVPTFPEGTGVMLTVARRPRMLTSTERRALADLVQAGMGQGLGAHAIVSTSVVARQVITSMNWFASKPFEEKVFPEVEPAIAWLKTHSPSLTDEHFAPARGFPFAD